MVHNMKEDIKNKSPYVTRASYTVEAALILPMVIFVIMALIYMSFYMHDKMKIQAIINSNILQGGLMVKHEWNTDNNETDYINIDNRGIYYPVIGETEDEVHKIKENLKNELSGKLYIAEIRDIVVEADHLKLSIKIEAVMNISILRVKDFFTGNGTHLMLSGNGRIHYPAEFVRQIDMVEEMINDRDGYGKVLEKLGAFLK